MDQYPRPGYPFAANYAVPQQGQWPQGPFAGQAPQQGPLVPPAVQPQPLAVVPYDDQFQQRPPVPFEGAGHVLLPQQQQPVNPGASNVRPQQVAFSNFFLVLGTVLFCFYLTNCVISFYFNLYLVPRTCASRFDMTGNLEFFFYFWRELNRAYIAPNHKTIKISNLCNASARLLLVRLSPTAKPLHTQIQK
jgi:hypothetical protein